jgi:hypothetical protein
MPKDPKQFITISFFISLLATYYFKMDPNGNPRESTAALPLPHGWRRDLSGHIPVPPGRFVERGLCSPSASGERSQHFRSFRRLFRRFSFAFPGSVFSVTLLFTYILLSPYVLEYLLSCILTSLLPTYLLRRGPFRVFGGGWWLQQFS